jgi:predicted amidophosphoribosyltransferase
VSSSTLRGRLPDPTRDGAVKAPLPGADVGQVEDTTAAGTRCARCSAAVRPGAPWCTQCYAPAGTTAGTAAGTAAATAVPQATAVVRTSTATWPCSACSQPNDLALPACEGCGTPFLSAVRAGRPTAVLPVVGDVLALTPARRVGLALVTVLVLLLTTAVLALLLA